MLTMHSIREEENKSRRDDKTPGNVNALSTNVEAQKNDYDANDVFLSRKKEDNF